MLYCGRLRCSPTAACSTGHVSPARKALDNRTGKQPGLHYTLEGEQHCYANATLHGVASVMRSSECMIDREQLQALGFTPRVHSTSDVAWLVPPLCTIPAGPFMMGTDFRSDPGFTAQLPKHEVSLPTYEIGRYPVTVAEYACTLAASADGLRAPVNWSLQSDFLLRPVFGLTWYDAVAYARWLSQQTGETWRLPSEAEWEKAARGTDGRIYPWGNDWDPARTNAWAAKASTDPELRHNFGETTSVDAYPLGASPYGVVDLTGNISQWTSTIDDPARFSSPYQADDGRDDLSVSARFRIERGGCWLSSPEYVRADLRESFHTTDRLDWLIGVRLVRDTSSG
jgi:formylglycine-generating enzyme required for sulfatase activity